MDYGRVYAAIIHSARNRSHPAGYTEKHHVVPRSPGGSNKKSNIVVLTGREHFLCHYCLAKIYNTCTSEWHKMNNAFLMMKCHSANTTGRYFNSRLYEAHRRNFSIVMSTNQSGINNSNYKTKWIYNYAEKKNDKIKDTDVVPPGWALGRVVNWDIPDTAKFGKCVVCNVLFFRITSEIFCSPNCKVTSLTNKHNNIKQTNKLSDLVNNHTIIPENMSANINFINDAIVNKISKNQILICMGFIGSGPNYAALNKILKDK